jgi:hypothetical protein
MEDRKFQFIFLTFPEGYVEHFIVWMRTAGLSDFRKLFGKIDAGLKQGLY